MDAAHNNHGTIVVEEVDGLLKVYQDGHVERLPVMPDVPCTWTSEPEVVTSRDVFFDHSVGLWARVYAPNRCGQLPLLVYFHGGGFCLGSAAWRCYHEFLARLSSLVSCVVVSVNYRLAPENRLPAAYEDGFTAVKWVRRQAAATYGINEHSWWRTKCNFSQMFLGGDSAGGAIALDVAAQLGSAGVPAWLKGMILIQPFFGGETRTASEKNSPQKSTLSLATSDCYWRLALPLGSNRDHPWCNPLAMRSSAKLEELRLPPPMLLCVSEMDILRDRNLEFCKAMKRTGKSIVE